MTRRRDAVDFLDEHPAGRVGPLLAVRGGARTDAPRTVDEHARDAACRLRSRRLGFGQPRQQQTIAPGQIRDKGPVGENDRRADDPRRAASR